MGVVSVTLAGRAAAARTMIDTARVERGDGVTTDDDTGVVTANWVTVYEGPAKRQARDNQAADPEAGGMTYTVTTYEDHFPVGPFEPKVGDRVTWVASALDPNLPGKVDRVVSVLHKTAATAYRVAVEEVT